MTSFSNQTFHLNDYNDNDNNNINNNLQSHPYRQHLSQNSNHNNIESGQHYNYNNNYNNNNNNNNININTNINYNNNKMINEISNLNNDSFNFDNNNNNNNSNGEFIIPKVLNTHQSNNSNNNIPIISSLDDVDIKNNDGYNNNKDNLSTQQQQEGIQNFDYKPPSIGPKSNSSLHHEGSNSSSPKIPGTPIGSRNFSLPLNNSDSINELNNYSSSRSESPLNNDQLLSRPNKLQQDRRSKSVDLSHLYLLDRNESTHFTLTNESLSGASHSFIKQHLGEQSQSSLLPRMKTIEMYRKNVKKSNDPKVLFQYAQYMLQTALTLDISDESKKDQNNNNNNVDQNNIDELKLKNEFLKEAIHYLKKLADKGYTDAQYLLADAYSSGATGDVKNKEAFSLFQGAAKHGHIESSYRTAYCYEEGLGVTRDARRALEFLRFAASKNHPAAMYKLGVYSFYSKMGLSDSLNTKKTGVQWLTRASNIANELINAAPYELAKIHERGFLDIIIPDRKYAMELYVQAASLGHVKSAAILGKAYEIGDENVNDLENKVIFRDSDLSIHYYTQAALGGDPESMLALCAWYLVGNPPNLPKDNAEAFQWALRAANNNLAKAQYTVGHFFEKGIGCEINEKNSNYWYNKAFKNGDPRAKVKLQKKKSIQALNNSNSLNSSSNKLNSSSSTTATTTATTTHNELNVDNSNPGKDTNTNVNNNSKPNKKDKKKTNKKKNDKDCSIM
ncbi:hypothetical protein WICMUC_002681 [Wickerhamomyces mucosus]|uniref:HCP-like protein n=1 Tax=Wickerhamomyces mucosus TaxID=1378264 RepID=A0A9P8PPB4_9ASCO|nr:hypothetical protein WICMUC_002681 [Wickerhamomyces mucosus]